jgi:hypothetical protein
MDFIKIKKKICKNGKWKFFQPATSDFANFTKFAKTEIL